MKEYLVSIITPSLNQGQFIEDCILSIKNQTYKSIEHIIVDGGSTDNTIEIIKKYEGQYNMRWISELDKGMYDAINKGIRMSRGEILAYLNCDDLYLPWSVSVAVKYLQKFHIIFGDCIFCNEDMTKCYLHFTPPFLQNYYKTVGVIAQPTVFFKREVFDKVGLFNTKTFRLISDCDYWLRCAFAGYKPKKVYEFLAIQRDYLMTQRFTKNELLKQEFDKLRHNYSEKSRLKIKAYYILMHLYWRVALFVFKAGWFSLWNNLRNSKVVNLSWPRYFTEILPLSIRSSLAQKPVLNLRLILLNNEKP